MDINIRHNDHFRIGTNGGENFIDVNGLDRERGIRVDAHPSFHYIEIREKGKQISTFYFQSKGDKKHVDLGWWEDAEVIFARNDVRHHKR